MLNQLVLDLDVPSSYRAKIRKNIYPLGPHAIQGPGKAQNFQPTKPAQEYAILQVPPPIPPHSLAAPTSLSSPPHHTSSLLDHTRLTRYITTRVPSTGESV
jgi:hypothetical protein